MPCARIFASFCSVCIRSKLLHGLILVEMRGSEHPLRGGISKKARLSLHLLHIECGFVA